MKTFIKRAINRWKRWSEAKQAKTTVSRLQKHIALTKGRKRLLFFQTPSHTNIGDHAIADAMIRFLSRNFPKYLLIEINQDYHFALLPKIKSEVTERDILILIGGGNFGNQYMHEEHIRRSVVNNFPDNKIVVFPQTVFYSSDEDGQRELQITQEFFAKGKDVVLTAREKVTQNLMERFFPRARVILTPDIVLSTRKLDMSCRRSGVLMVLRDDEEKILDHQTHRRLEQFANTLSKYVTYSDMHYHKGVRTTQERDVMLDYKFRQFQTAGIVFTDRLHGMVFAAVTGTPCIAFSNYNQKVSGTYEWIKHLDYIHFVNPDDDWEREAERLLSQEPKAMFDPDIFQKYFTDLIEAIDGTSIDICNRTSI